jgi:alpha-tubulin suppressor-like RCC1 family protein
MEAIAAGSFHACALTTSGGVKCWGDNVDGQLGDNSITQRLAPVDVFGLAAGVAAVVAGERHTCALTEGGNVKCWGRNSEGQLGDTTATARNTPTSVSGLSSSGLAMLAAGQSHTCALTLAGGVKCWGFNDVGQLGDNSVTQSLAPVDVSGLTSGVAYIAASASHTCAVTTGGGAKCWGANTSGSLGEGTTTDRHVPSDVSGLASGVVAVAMGPDHACAVTTVGGAKCWGANVDGRLGDGSNSQRLTPVDVVGLASGVAAISAGYLHSCALSVGGSVQCWGENSTGQLGDGTTLARNVPGNVTGLPGISQMEAGAGHTCVLTAGGAVKCWGRNQEGQLGNATFTAQLLPGNVTGLTSGITALATGDYHTCGLTSAGGVKCWGDNSFGELGDVTTTGRSLPVDVFGLAAGIADIDAAYSQTCALTTAGGVKCWGYNANGQLGDLSTTSRMTPVSAMIGGQSIAFTPPTQLMPGVPATLSATASSSLAVTFDSWTPDICTVTGKSVTAGFAGLCGLRASQAGNGNVDSAPQELRLVMVLATASDFDNDGIPNAVEVAEGRNPLVKDNDVFSPGAASAWLFAMQQYRDFLGREGEPSGIQGWADAVSGGSWTHPQVIDAFLSSPEFGGFVAPVVRLYFATFLRVPDYAGLSVNAGLVRNGTLTLRQLADFFAASPEFAAIYGTLNNTQFVTLLYANVLGRAPDTAGVNGWVSLLDSGYTRGQVLLGFSDSAEYQNIIANEVFATMMYAGMLRRTPEPAGFSGWVGFLDAGTYTREQVINGFFLSTEYRMRFLP